MAVANNASKPAPLRGAAKLRYDSPMQLSAFLVALLSGVSALAGVALGHIFAAKRARQDELAAMRMAAYVDFLRSTSLLFTARRAGRTKDEVEELAHLNDAKTRILLTADLPVVKSLQQFWLQGGTLEKEQEILAFRNLCNDMRESLGKEQLALQMDLAGVLFKLEPSTYSFKVSD
ncbi:hypothetical protein JR064_04795 [Xanthomonas sp. CFBP 8703]|uniref:Uncharacterized protein n=1 Tax=Xanthomonas bonasiae TaxID=2810351 RepID=A0ABS3AZG2_9XANT|nr:hypothetical protein [Xanthomonas bonasiae]MBN6101478.1 hypothetical protein [Xanthomonas bonasiae]